MATTKPKPRPEEEIDVSPRAEAGDQFFVEEAEKKAKSFSDIKPKIRPDSDKYKGRTYDIYSVEVDGKETNVIEFKDGKRISTPQIRQMFEKYKSASEPILGKQTSQEISNFLEKNNPTYDEFIKHFTAKRLNKGGTPMLEEQMELFNEGGLKDEGGEVDPESGNDVPIGSTKKEVRDDIPAMLSEGEFVFPADVVRYIGLEKLMELRQAAKMGLKKMEAMGQMGNSEEATIPDDMPFNMADLIIVSGEPEEDKPKEMAEGGVVYANQGTFMPSTGIGGYQQSVFQNQPQVAAPYVPPSSVAPPPPAPSPAGGYMPKFVTNQTTPFDDGSLAPKTTTTSTTTADTTGTATTETDKFLPTVEDVYTQKEYINPETGETRIINFYNDSPINEIPEGFIPKEDYTADETTTTDLESTSVETTQVRDDKSGTKQRLEDMVRQQSGNKLSKLREDKDPEAIKQAYLDNEKTKAFMTSIGIANPVAALAGRGAAGLYGKQLENLMEELGIEKPEIETGFFENLKGAVSDMFAGAGEQPETYQPMFKPEDSPLSTVSGATNMLSMDEAKAYDNAVKSGDANVAEHYEIINNRLNKMSDYMEGKAVSGLSTYDIEQAEKQFEKGTGAKLGDSVNEAEAAKKAAADKAARDKRKKYQKEQREKQQKRNEDFTKKKLKEFKETGKVTGFKEGGLASHKK
jgi:hypothetical protein